MKLFGGRVGGHGRGEKPPAPPGKSAEEAPRGTPSPSAQDMEASSLPLVDWLKRIRFPKPNWRKLRIPLLALGIVLLLAIVGVILYFLWEKPPTEAEPALATPTLRPAVSDYPTPPPPETAPPTPTEFLETPEPTEEVHEVRRRENVYTFVLLAKDQVGASTDTVMVARLDAENNRLDVVSIPRDTLVNVSWGVKKLCTVYGGVRGDMVSFNTYLTDLLGFPVDHYAVVDVSIVERLVNAMGGITYYVPRDMDYDDPDQDLHIHISEGYQYLTGTDTVKVLRYRMGNDGTGYQTGDIGRIGAQHDLLKSVAAQLLQAGNIPHLDQIIEIFRTSVTTDLSANNLAFLAREFLEMDKDNIRFYTAPGHSVGIRGGSYYELELEGWLEIVNEALDPYDAEVTAANLNLLRTLEEGGAISTTGELVPKDSFLNFYELG